MALTGDAIMPVLEDKAELLEGETPPGEERQRRRMAIALGLLLVALALVLIKDRSFWFPVTSTAEVDEGEEPEEAVPSSPDSSSTELKAEHPVRPVKHVPAVPKPPISEIQPPPVVVTSRAALPPLEVEVVAGDERRTLRPGSNSIKVDLQPGRASANPEATLSATTASGPATEAGDRVRLSVDTSQALSRPVNPNYPLLARQMKVQGSVLLQALISKDGQIQDLQVLSGPTILATAAREAVKQWRFKPYYQQGDAVETQARITVNFTISTN